MAKKIVILIFLLMLIFPSFVLASSDAYNSLKKVGEEGGTAPYAAADQYKLAEIVGIVIQAFLGLLGVIFLVLIIYAGFNWMTAQGEEEKVNKAKDTLQRAVIGLIITIAAYAISTWVLVKLIFTARIL
ncbi:MAG: hypothetical protein WCV70_01335 [Patescibacteria group bacterium]|jgi:ABC-type Fe3+ transport system permease subunit